MFFLLFGSQTKVKPIGEQQVPRLCPRCNNAAIFEAKKSTWLELFFIPVVPLSSKHVWMCGICQFAAKSGPGQWEPAPAVYPPPNQGWQQQGHYVQGPYQAPTTHGYQPAYIQNSK